MRILVTGREGQVVSCLVEAAEADPLVEIVTIGRPDLDLARPQTLRGHLARLRPDLLVSAAAYTGVDRAEDEPDAAMAVNGLAPGVISGEAAALDVPVIHLSTDYVFSGDKAGPYVEIDPTGPTGIYGASKLAGEKAVAAADPKHLILRTAWVYSAYGANFVKTMLRLAETRDEIGVVSDQWGSPTSAHDIAEGILHIARRLRDDTSFDGWGVYHLAGAGEASWAGFARHILDISRLQGGPYTRIKNIATADYPTKARRPTNSRLDTGKLTETFGWQAPDWRKSTEAVVARLLGAGMATAGER